MCEQDCCEKDWCLATYHPECRALGLEGPKCPDDYGVFHDCCQADPVARSWTFEPKSQAVQEPSAAAPRVVNYAMTTVMMMMMMMVTGFAWVLA